MMKRTITALLAAVMALSLAACGKQETSDSGLTGSLTDIVGEIYENVTTEIAISDPQAIDLSDTDALAYYLGLSSAEGISEAVVSEAMMSAVPYSMCLVRTEDGADVESIKNEIFENINPGKWICVVAEQLAVTNYGDVILVVMGFEDEVSQVQESFAALAGGELGQTLTRAGIV